jgi:CubicO group peptidase (beta-lactamase class C family)
MVEQTRQKFEIPAIAVVIMRSDEVLLTEIQGVRVRGTGQDATLDDYFHIGSCAKSVLAFIAGKLVEEGKIQWGTPFFKVFPELRDIAEAAYHPVTLEDLFLCKAGIKAYTSGDEKYPSLDPSIADQRYGFAKYLIQESPASKHKNDEFPFLYSNASYTLAALMLERVSRLSYEQLIGLYLTRELELEPCFGFPNKLNPDQPWGHMIEKGRIVAFPPDHEYEVPSLIRPAGHISMPPMDHATYIQLNLQGLRGVDNSLSSDTYNYIHFGHKGFSLGVANGKMSGHKYSGMDGSAGTFFCRTIIMPGSDLAFVVMTNAGSGTGRMRAVDRLTRKILKSY